MPPIMTSAQPLAAGNVVVPNENEPQQLLRAKGYPYPRPDTSFLFVRGDVFEFDNEQWRGLNRLHEIVGCCGSSAADFCSTRGMDPLALSRQELFVPVLAIGSNAGPEQLRRKYPRADFPDCVIPVIQVALEDFDVVYTPYIASYGSCTATLEHSPGTVTSIFITYLTAPLMGRMHATEGGYNLCRLSGLRMHVAPCGSSRGRRRGMMSASLKHPGDTTTATATSSEVKRTEAEDERTDAAAAAAAGAVAVEPETSFEVRDWVYQYNHKLGCIELPMEGRAGGCSPVAIAEIPAQRRTFPAARQEQMLAAIRAALGGSSEAGPLTPVEVPAADLQLPRDDGLDEWILHMIRSSGARDSACRRLAGSARPFAYPLSELVAVL